MRGYDAFGLLRFALGTPQGPFGFAGSSGYQEDGDSGLKLLGHRYYDASTGRFLTRDPAEDGRNWYAYVNENPLRGLDPTGLENFLLDAASILWQLPQELGGLIGGIGGKPVRPKPGDGFLTTHIQGGWLTAMTGVPMTFGTVILDPVGPVYNWTWNHEQVHQNQSVILGPMYIPAILLGYVVGMGRGNVHDGNPMEQDADERSGRWQNIQRNPFTRL